MRLTQDCTQRSLSMRQYAVVRSPLVCQCCRPALLLVTVVRATSLSPPRPAVMQQRRGADRGNLASRNIMHTSTQCKISPGFAVTGRWWVVGQA